MRVHPGARLGPEVLDDDLLDVPIPSLQPADGEERFGALPERLSDADEDARREGDGEPSGVLDGAQADRRDLVGRAVMRHAPLREPVGRLLQHQPHGRRDVLEPCHLLPRHDPRVEVREQPGLLDDPDGDGANVVQRRREPS